MFKGLTSCFTGGSPPVDARRSDEAAAQSQSTDHVPPPPPPRLHPSARNDPNMAPTVLTPIDGARVSPAGTPSSIGNTYTEYTDDRYSSGATNTLLIEKAFHSTAASAQAAPLSTDLKSKVVMDSAASRNSLRITDFIPGALVPSTSMPETLVVSNQSSGALFAPCTYSGNDPTPPGLFAYPTSGKLASNLGPSHSFRRTKTHSSRFMEVGTKTITRVDSNNQLISAITTNSPHPLSAPLEPATNGISRGSSALPAGTSGAPASAELTDNPNGSGSTGTLQLNNTFHSTAASSPASAHTTLAAPAAPASAELTGNPYGSGSTGALQFKNTFHSTAASAHASAHATLASPAAPASADFTDNPNGSGPTDALQFKNPFRSTTASAQASAQAPLDAPAAPAATITPGLLGTSEPPPVPTKHITPTLSKPSKTVGTASVAIQEKSSSVPSGDLKKEIAGLLNGVPGIVTVLLQNEHFQYTVAYQNDQSVRFHGYWKSDSKQLNQDRGPTPLSPGLQFLEHCLQLEEPSLFDHLQLLLEAGDNWEGTVRAQPAKVPTSVKVSPLTTAAVKIASLQQDFEQHLIRKAHTGATAAWVAASCANPPSPPTQQSAASSENGADSTMWTLSDADNIYSSRGNAIQSAVNACANSEQNSAERNASRVSNRSFRRSVPNENNLNSSLNNDLPNLPNNLPNDNPNDDPNSFPNDTPNDNPNGGQAVELRCSPDGYHMCHLIRSNESDPSSHESDAVKHMRGSVTHVSSCLSDPEIPSTTASPLPLGQQLPDHHASPSAHASVQPIPDHPTSSTARASGHANLGLLGPPSPAPHSSAPGTHQALPQTLIHYSNAVSVIPPSPPPHSPGAHQGPPHTRTHHGFASLADPGPRKFQQMGSTSSGRKVSWTLPPGLSSVAGGITHLRRPPRRRATVENMLRGLSGRSRKTSNLSLSSLDSDGLAPSQTAAVFNDAGYSTCTNVHNSQDLSATEQRRRTFFRSSTCDLANMAPGSKSQRRLLVPDMENSGVYSSTYVHSLLERVSETNDDLIKSQQDSQGGESSRDALPPLCQAKAVETCEGREVEGGADSAAAAATADGAKAEGAGAPTDERLHQLKATCVKLHGREGVLIVQTDVSKPVGLQHSLESLVNAQLSLLCSMFPTHVLKQLCIMGGKGPPPGPAEPHVTTSAPVGKMGPGLIAAVCSLPATNNSTDVASAQAGKDESTLGALTHAATESAENSSKLIVPHPQVTVVCVELAGFAELCTAYSPEQLVHFLSSFYFTLSCTCQMHGLVEVEAGSGHTFIAAAGLWESSERDSNYTGVAAPADALNSEWEMPSTLSISQHYTASSCMNRPDFQALGADQRGGVASPCSQAHGIFGARSALAFAKAAHEAMAQVDSLGMSTPSARVAIHSGPCASGLMGGGKGGIPRFTVQGATIMKVKVMASTTSPGATTLSDTTNAALGLMQPATSGKLFRRRGSAAVYGSALYGGIRETEVADFDEEAANLMRIGSNSSKLPTLTPYKLPGSLRSVKSTCHLSSVSRAAQLSVETAVKSANSYRLGDMVLLPPASSGALPANLPARNADPTQLFSDSFCPDTDKTANAAFGSSQCVLNSAANCGDKEGNEDASRTEAFVPAGFSKATAVANILNALAPHTALRAVQGVPSLFAGPSNPMRSALEGGEPYHPMTQQYDFSNSMSRTVVHSSYSSVLQACGNALDNSGNANSVFNPDGSLVPSSLNGANHAIYTQHRYSDAGSVLNKGTW